MKKQHAQELEEQKEGYSMLLRDENSKWKLQKEELEKEILSLKTKQQTNLGSKSLSFNTQSQTSRTQEADLTAIIKDLKESSNLLNPGTSATSSSGSGKKRTSSRSNLSSSSSSVYNSNVNSYDYLLWSINFYF